MSKKLITKGAPPKQQQAASLARKMAGKKGIAVQLQVEVNNEEDWEKLLAKEGLIVADVYSDWSGPCSGMIGNLRRAKVEFGGDALHLAVARNDEIEVLSRFRNRSEPTWLFIAGGQLITVMFGANAPKLIKMIENELRQELRVMKGETWRHGVPLDELCEEEKERIETVEKYKMESKRLEREKIEREIEARRLKMYNQMAELLLYETVILCLPHAFDNEQLLKELDSFCRSQMVYVSHHAKVIVTREMFQEIFFRGGLEPTDDLMQDLASGLCYAMLLKCQIIVAPGQEDEKDLGDIEKLICSALNQVTLESDQELVIPAPGSIPAKYPYVKKYREEFLEEEDEEEVSEEITSVPGCWTPATYVTKCAAIRYLFPARAEKVMIPEEPPPPPKIVIIFDIPKQKEVFDLIEENEQDVLNHGYFTSADPATAEPLCATPQQYEKLTQQESHKLVLVINASKEEPTLSFAGLGATYISPDETVGATEADLFFPPGVDPFYRRLTEIENLAEEEDELGEEELQEEEEESIEQTEDDLMALLGL